MKVVMEQKWPAIQNEEEACDALFKLEISKFS